MRHSRLLLMGTILLTGLLTVSLTARPARAGVDLGDILGSFQITIGDTGDRYDGWENCASRVYMRVADRRGYAHDHYFSDIASAFYVLRQDYGSARVLELQVPEYAGTDYGWRDGVYTDRDTSAAARTASTAEAARGTSGIYVEIGDDAGASRGPQLLDGLHAYYFWDRHRLAPGGLPLIYAFGDYRDAQDMAYSRDGDAMGFRDLAARLNAWARERTPQIYWRGRDPYCTPQQWNSAWDQRWQGYGWDNTSGWTLRLNINTGGHDRDRDWDRNHHDDRNDRHWQDGRGGWHSSGAGHRNGDGDRTDRPRGERDGGRDNGQPRDSGQRPGGGSDSGQRPGGGGNSQGNHNGQHGNHNQGGGQGNHNGQPGNGGNGSGRGQHEPQQPSPAVHPNRHEDQGAQDEPPARAQPREDHARPAPSQQQPAPAQPSSGRHTADEHPQPKPAPAPSGGSKGTNDPKK